MGRTTKSSFNIFQHLVPKKTMVHGPTNSAVSPSFHPPKIHFRRLGRGGSAAHGPGCWPESHLPGSRDPAVWSPWNLSSNSTVWDELIYLNIYLHIWLLLIYHGYESPFILRVIWVCLKIISVPLHTPNGFADHYPVSKWLFHWGYTPFSDIPIWKLWRISRMIVIHAIWINMDYWSLTVCELENPPCFRGIYHL